MLQSKEGIKNDVIIKEVDYPKITSFSLENNVVSSLINNNMSTRKLSYLTYNNLLNVFLFHS